MTIPSSKKKKKEKEIKLITHYLASKNLYTKIISSSKVRTNQTSKPAKTQPLPPEMLPKSLWRSRYWPKFLFSQFLFSFSQFSLSKVQSFKDIYIPSGLCASLWVWLKICIWDEGVDFGGGRQGFGVSTVCRLLNFEAFAFACVLEPGFLVYCGCGVCFCF